MSGVFPNMRGALSFAVESQGVVTAAAVALGVPELDAEKSSEMDGKLLVVLSLLTDGESPDVVTSAGGDRGFESWRKLHESSMEDALGAWQQQVSANCPTFFTSNVVLLPTRQF